MQTKLKNKFQKEYLNVKKRSIKILQENIEDYNVRVRKCFLTSAEKKNIFDHYMKINIMHKVKTP